MERYTQKITNMETGEVLAYRMKRRHCARLDDDMGALQKMGKFEDLQESERLLELPCAIGDTVYVIAECENISPQLDGTLYSADGSPGTATGYYCPYEDNCPHDCEGSTDCDDYKKKKAVFEDKVSQITYDGFGITVYTSNCGVCGHVGHERIFLTKEEAEEALNESEVLT